MRIGSMVFLMSALFLMGCDTIPKDALSMTATTMADRQQQTRVYNTTDEDKILSASAGVLQDLGFNIDESETEVGLIVASKDRDATDAGQVTAAIAVAVLVGGPARFDKHQKIKVSVVTSPRQENAENMSVRVTFQRIVWDNYDQVCRLERLNEAELYQGFFEKLSKSVFLEAQGI